MMLSDMLVFDYRLNSDENRIENSPVVLSLHSTNSAFELVVSNLKLGCFSANLVEISSDSYDAIDSQPLPVAHVQIVTKRCFQK